MLLLIIIPDNLILGHPITDILFFSQIIPDNFIAVGGGGLTLYLKILFFGHYFLVMLYLIIFFVMLFLIILFLGHISENFTFQIIPENFTFGSNYSR